jgi:hypothetical protein
MAAPPANRQTASNFPKGTGNEPVLSLGLLLTSQLRVKLGMIRPPISIIRKITTAKPARRP